jgi:hypothetical protein
MGNVGVVIRSTVVFLGFLFGGVALVVFSPQIMSLAGYTRGIQTPTAVVAPAQPAQMVDIGKIVAEVTAAIEPKLDLKADKAGVVLTADFDGRFNALAEGDHEKLKTLVAQYTNLHDEYLPGLDGRVGALQSALDKAKTDLAALEVVDQAQQGKINAFDGRFNANGERITALETANKTTGEQVASLVLRVKALEDEMVVAKSPPVAETAPAPESNPDAMAAAAPPASNPAETAAQAVSRVTIWLDRFEKCQFTDADLEKINADTIPNVSDEELQQYLDACSTPPMPRPRPVYVDVPSAPADDGQPMQLAGSLDYDSATAEDIVQNWAQRAFGPPPADSMNTPGGEYPIRLTQDVKTPPDGRKDCVWVTGQHVHQGTLGLWQCPHH